jgi:uncharacterized protein YgiM (DUF1202 family)
MSEHPSAFSEFSRTIWAKVLGVLTVIMMLLGIYVELVTSWRGTSEALIAATNIKKAQAEAQVAQQKADNATKRESGEAEKLEGEGITSQAIAREAALRQEAERREKQALAEKAAADQRTAEAIANESRLRQEAERREKQALAELTTIKALNAPQRERGEAEKVQGEGVTSQAIAYEAKLRQEAERKEKQALAQKAAAEAQYQTWLTETVTGRRVTTPQEAPNYITSETRDFQNYAGLSYALGRLGSQRAASVEECQQLCLTGSGAYCVGGTFFQQSRNCTLFNKMRISSVERNPDAVGFLRKGQELIGEMWQPKPLPRSTPQASAAESFEKSIQALNNVAGDWPGARVRPAEFQPTQKVTISASVAPTAPPPPQKLIVSVAADQLTLRHDPDKTAEAILVLNKGAQVQVMSTDAEGWQQVAIVDHGVSFKGYVNGKYTTTDLSASPVPVIITEPTDLGTPAFCGHENEPIEYIICSNAELAGQESAMVKSYTTLLTRINDATALRRSQTQWVNERRLSCNVPAKGRPTRTVPANMVQCVMDSTDARKHNLRMGRY